MVAAENILQGFAEKVGGPSTRKHRDWFNEIDAEIQKLLQAKRPVIQSLSPSWMTMLPRQHTG